MKLIAATNNSGKVKEIRQILGGFGAEIISLKEAGIELEAEENGATFEENALIKARAAAEITHRPVIADDSGLCVDALGGAPGIYSARYAGEDADDEARINKLLAELSGVEKEKRTAHFVSAAALVLPDGREFTARGTADGYIAESPCGNGGFGYDPVFVCAHTNKTYALMSAEEKNAVSHRFKALEAMRDIINKEKIDFRNMQTQ